MLRTVWFLIKLGLLTGAAVWLLYQPGQVRVQWMDYTLETYLGVVLAGLLIAIVVTLILYRFILAIARLPSAWRKNRKLKNRDKGYRALTIGFSALAATDVKTALKQAGQAKKLLKQEKGLPLLIEAQAARMEGREDEAKKLFETLAEDKDTSFLGVRGLLQNALDNPEKTETLNIAHKALEHHPKQPWILKMTYDLEVAARDFQNALRTLKRAEKQGAIPSDQAQKDRIAIALYEGDQLLKNNITDKAERKYRQAYNMDKSFVPAAERLARFYLEQNKRRNAVGTLEKTWKLIPHPDLARLWGQAKPKDSQGDPVKTLSWYKRLMRANPTHPESYIAYAHAAAVYQLWGEAREYLELAEAQSPDIRVYKMLAEVEEKAGTDLDIVKAWLEKAAEAPPEKIWICSKTGRVYERWEPVAEPHGSFNTIRWDTAGSVYIGKDLAPAEDHYTMLEAL